MYCLASPVCTAFHWHATDAGCAVHTDPASPDTVDAAGTGAAFVSYNKVVRDLAPFYDTGTQGYMAGAILSGPVLQHSTSATTLDECRGYCTGASQCASFLWSERRKECQARTDTPSSSNVFAEIFWHRTFTIYTKLPC